MSLEWVSVHKHLQNLELQVHRKHLGSKGNKIQKCIRFLTHMMSKEENCHLALKQVLFCATGQLAHMSNKYKCVIIHKMPM